MGILNIIVSATTSRVRNFVHFARKYTWKVSNTNLDTIKKSRLTSIKKYQKYAGQIKIKLDWLYNLILALVTFVRYSRKLLDNKKVTKNIKVKQSIDTNIK